LLRQQLTMTGVGGAEEIEDGLAAPRRPHPKIQRVSPASPASPASPDVFSITGFEQTNSININNIRQTIPDINYACRKRILSCIVVKGMIQ